MSDSRRFLWASYAVGTLSALALSAALASRRLVTGSIEGQFYSNIHAFGYRSLRVWLVATLAAAICLTFTKALERRHPALVAAGWLLLGFAIQVLIRAALTPIPIDAMFASDVSNSFYSVTLHYPASAVLRDFDRLRASWPAHAHSNMPGKIILVYALELLSTRADVLAWLVVLLSSLGGIFVYLFALDLFDSSVVAIYSEALYLVAPARVLFLPILNTVTPVVVFACAFLLQRWLRGARLTYAVAFGVSLYLLLFFEPTAAAMGIVFAALTGYELLRGSISWRVLIGQSIAVLLSFAAVHVGMRLAFGFDLFHALSQVVSDGMAFNAEDQRPYWLWVRQNPIDFFFGVGMCQAVVFWCALGERVFSARTWTDRLTDPMTMLGIGLAATFVALDLIGANRGEVTRLWIFLACAFQIPAAYVCARLQSRTALFLMLTTTLLESAIATSMIGFVGP